MKVIGKMMKCMVSENSQMKMVLRKLEIEIKVKE